MGPGVVYELERINALAVKRGERVDGIRWAIAVQFQIRNLPAGHRGQGQTDHLQPMILGCSRAVRPVRRPGRVAYTSPALIALLRRSRAAPTAPAPERTDDLGAARGIGRAVAVGVVMWAVILLAIRALWLA